VEFSAIPLVLEISFRYEKHLCIVSSAYGYTRKAGIYTGRCMRCKKIGYMNINQITQNLLFWQMIEIVTTFALENMEIKP